MVDGGYEDRIDDELEKAWADACNGIYVVLKRGRSTVGSRAEGPSMTESQVAMLESVAEDGPLKVGEIAHRAGLSQPTVTRMVKTLEGQGLVRKFQGAGDARTAYVELTEAGREVWEHKHQLLRHWQRDALMHFAPDRRGEVVEMLSSLVRIIDEQIADR